MATNKNTRPDDDERRLLRDHPSLALEIERSRVAASFGVPVERIRPSARGVDVLEGQLALPGTTSS